MKQQEVFKKIGGIIREINEQYEYLETVDGVLNELELELMVANSHFLSDHIEILRKLNARAAAAPSVQPEPPATGLNPTTAGPVSEPHYFEPFTAQTEEEEQVDKPITYPDEAPATTIEFEVPRLAKDHTDHFPPDEDLQAEQPAPETVPAPEFAPADDEAQTIRHELTMEDIGGDWDEDEADEAVATTPAPVTVKPAPEEVKPEEPEPIPVEPDPLAEQPLFTPVPQPKPVEPPHTQIMVDEEQVLTLNQRMSAQLTTSRMADNLHVQSISDLKSAISLNDKLLYIKDLFNGYGLAYSEAIDTLNRFKTFEEAESFLKSTYSTKNNWQDKQTTVAKFYALLQRRYV